MSKIALQPAVGGEPLPLAHDPGRGPHLPSLEWHSVCHRLDQVPQKWQGRSLALGHPNTSVLPHFHRYVTSTETHLRISTYKWLPIFNWLEELHREPCVSEWLNPRKERLLSPKRQIWSTGQRVTATEVAVLNDFSCWALRVLPVARHSPSLAARPVVTRYLKPPVFSAVASQASHSCSSSCQQLSVSVAAKIPVHSCDQSFTQQDVLNRYHVVGRGPDVPWVTSHTGVWNAFFLLLGSE